MVRSFREPERSGDSQPKAARRGRSPATNAFLPGEIPDLPLPIWTLSCEVVFLVGYGLRKAGRLRVSM
jgi:hypothetical protein